ncbi:MAG TPA: ABC transporter ATP-binding protein [Polyangiales bacterium]|nr:ABC transporter ATP-binding protein [Polyangiales bacterium]
MSIAVPGLIAAEEREGVVQTRGKIVVRDLRKSFSTEQGALEVIGGISFTLGDGQILAIVGPSGCGKSTLMNIVAGFDQPDQGSVFVDGAARSGANPKGIMITQQGSVFPWLNVRENVLFGLRNAAREERLALADHYITLVGLQGFEQRYPHELSGGMLKRVEIARALAMKPEVLYMDEPFSALDALMSMRMRVELLRILEQQQLSVVLITHDVEEAIQLADQILVLSQRPTTVKARFDVPWPHPRKVTGQEVQSLKESVLALLGLG